MDQILAILSRILLPMKKGDGSIQVNSVTGGPSPQFVSYPPAGCGTSGAKETPNFGDRPSMEEQERQQQQMQQLLGQLMGGAQQGVQS
jgi:hypothetical protein